VTFSKENLEKIMASCIAMATLDGEITEDEIHPVVAFVENNWKSDYGDINDFSVKARDGAEDILKSSSLTESIGEIADSLSSSLDVLKLLSVVLHADDEGHDLEHAMYNIFTQRFHS
jgi:uncharacterized protein YpuA (DUF1002 family)